MTNRTFPLLLIFFLFPLSNVLAQQNPSPNVDSLKFYRDIEKFSKKRGFTKFLYKLVLKPVAVAPAKPKKKSKSLKPRNIDLYNCRIIRHITIEVTDPFGYSLLDTAQKPRSFVQKKGNFLHNKSTKFSIRNFLVFKTGDEFEAFRISESERLMRQSGLFRDVIIYPIPDSKLKDSVDIIVRALDRWSISAKIVASTSRVSVRVSDKNIGGLGHTLSNRTDFNKDGFSGYSVRYDINRIENTYINLRLFQEKLSAENYSTSATLFRPFYSPIAKWSYGGSLYSTKYPEVLFFSDSLVSVPRVYNKGYDAYLSRSIRLNQTGATFEKNVKFLNLILSGRSIHRLQETSLNFADTLFLYKPLNYYLGMVALSKISYEQENFIFRFGETEDIPIGKFAGFTFGYDTKRFTKYTGLRGCYAGYNRAYYISLIADIGKYYEANNTSRNAFNFRVTTFGPLWEMGTWKFRQFFRANYVTGVNLLPNRFLVLNSQPGLERVNVGGLPGLNRLTFSLQSQAFAEWQFIGFRFAPVLYLNGGLISVNRNDLFNSKLYSSLGIGVLIRNDLLVSSNFQISLSFFPNLFGGKDWYRLNDIQTTDFGLPGLGQDQPDFVQFN